MARLGPLAKGVNTLGGHITCEAVAADLGLLPRYRDIESML